MAKTPSKMVELGTAAPEFSLPDTVSDSVKSFTDCAGSTATLVMFICNHCPFVKHIHPQMKALVSDYAGKEIGFVAISSNDVANYPDDRPELMKELFSELGLSFPYLYDESQDVAKAYGAECTPDFFLYDSSRALAYRGQLDASRPGNDEPLDGADLRAAMDALIAGEAPSSDQKPSIGCNIKWLS